MDKAFIFSVYDFVCFHICKTLLNQGIEVRGMYAGENRSETYIDEKRLEVGRNANFEEVDFLHDDIIEINNHKGITFISFYDLFMLDEDSVLQCDRFKERFYQLVNEKSGSLVFLLPVQMLGESNQKRFLDIREFLNMAGDNNNKKFVYLPTIYGPWQPSTFLFQHSILCSINKHSEFKGLREATNDAMFIDDAVDSILEIAEKRPPGSYILQTGKKGQWERCAASLNIEINDSEFPKNFQHKDDVITIKPKRLTSISDSMSIQVNHVKQLLNE
jgi:hypothetical protein